jgi:arylsulfatase A-like enzyme
MFFPPNMNCKIAIAFPVICFFAGLLSHPLAIKAADTPATERPNILVILTDDQGYADSGFQGSKDIPTPHMDKLAASGLRCTSAYVSHPYCSPSRAGMLTGRCQMRFGHERNPRYLSDSPAEGLPTSEKLLPEFLAKAGYATGWIGKWHLGAAAELLPEHRGFQETFGFLGGGHNYMNWKPDDKSEYLAPILRNGKPVDVTNHLTVAFGDEAAGFINRHKAQPWFLYLAFNAPHMPNQPTPERLARFSSITNKLRRSYAAQVSLLDDAIGETLDAVRASGQAERTIVFFLSDNGGPTYNGADNGPLHGGKSMTYDGGIHVPFVVSWPGHLPSGKDYDPMVSSLDIFATALACADVPMPADKPYDGVNLMPYLTGKTRAAPHQSLYWRATENGKRRWGVRDHNLKLIWQVRSPTIYSDKYSCISKDGLTLDEWLKHSPEELYDLSTDPGERNDLSLRKPEDTRRLKGELETWDKQAAPLAFGGNDGPDDGPHP